MAARALLAALLLAASAPSSPVGPDGRFQYALAYGALDEEATGRWRRVGNHLLLTTLPKPVPPVFSTGKATRTAEAALALHVTWPNGRGIAGVEFRIEFESGDPLEDYINNDEGWNMPPGEHRKPVAVILAEPIYRVASPRFPIDTSKANDLTFILTPHDMGKIEFGDIPIDIAPGKLVMHRGGTELVYMRER